MELVLLSRLKAMRTVRVSLRPAGVIAKPDDTSDSCMHFRVD